MFISQKNNPYLPTKNAGFWCYLLQIDSLSQHCSNPIAYALELPITRLTDVLR